MTSSSSFLGDTFFGIDLKQLKVRWQLFRRRASKRVLLIDFGSTSINLAEAQIQFDTINFQHVQRVKLPEDALERGVPADPAMMASLILSYCREANIPAHRAAVVLPHASAYTTVVQLPRSVSPDMALEYVLNPVSGVQIPVQIDQMDVDLLPLELPDKDISSRSYFLTAVPRKLVDRVLQTLQAADLELLRLQVGVFAQMQHISLLLTELSKGSMLLYLELLRDCTLVTLMSGSGPVKVVRLTGIRDFPEPPESSLNSLPLITISAEAQIIASDAYLPLSDLDLRRLNLELKQFISECVASYQGLCLERVVIAGWNSAHPMLASLLEDSLNLPVQVSHPLSSPGVGQFIPDLPMVLQGMGRLVGLGLSLIPSTAVVTKQPQELQHSIIEHLPDVEISETAENFERLEIIPDEIAQPPQLELTSEPEPEIAAIEVPAFSFAEEPQEAIKLIEPVPIATSEVIANDVPFSCGDLFSSFEAKAEEQNEPIDDAHLADDPTLWPSIAKLEDELIE